MASLSLEAGAILNSLATWRENSAADLRSHLLYHAEKETSWATSICQLARVLGQEEGVVHFLLISDLSCILGLGRNRRLSAEGEETGPVDAVFADQL